MEYLGLTLRNEVKYYINYSVYHTLRNRIKEVLNPDENMKRAEGYLVSSLYFDDIYHSALEEKQAGVKTRKKFRIRCYDLSDSLIKLECKRKHDKYISKISANLTREEYNKIISGDYSFLATRSERVCKDLFTYHKTRLYKPSVAVEYMREAYVLPQGNVRITFDKNISASGFEYDMFSNLYSTHEILEPDVMVLEIKFDEYIPTYVLNILRTAMVNNCAISKYVMCRQKKRRILYR